jgi:hypothetical protein
MPIPTEFDHHLGEIDNLANTVKVRLMTMRHAGSASRDFAGLRDVLQEYVEAVMEFAHGTEP